MIVHAYYPIGEIRVEREALALIERGYEVDVICLKQIGEAVFSVEDGVNVHRLPVRRHKGKGIAVQFLEYLAFFILSMFKVAALHLKRRYSVVQVHNLPDFLIFSAIVPKLSGARLILDLHDLMPEFYSSRFSSGMTSWPIRLLCWQEKLACLFANHVFTVTELWRQTLIERGVPSGKVSVVMNVANDRIFQRSNVQPVAKNGHFNLIYHGQLSQRYGIDLAIQAVDLLRKEIPEIWLTIHGRGEYLHARDPAAGRERFKVTVTAYPGDGTARVVVSCEYAGGPQGSEPVPREGMVRTGILPYNKMAERKRRERLRELDRKVAEGGPVANRLLAVLPRKDYRRLRAGFETVTLVRGMVLYEPGDRIRHVYFPIGSVVSLLTTVEGHEALEVGLVGREGMVGISLAVGMDVASVRAVVQGTGTAMRLESGRFRQELLQCRLLQNELHRYAHAKLAQARQIVACSCFHDVEERLACWLLMARDRVEGDQFFLTQEFLSQMLGVRREGVTRAAGRLHKRELIEFSRGYIRILDRRGLEGASCSCYRVFRSIHS